MTPPEVFDRWMRNLPRYDLSEFVECGIGFVCGAVVGVAIGWGLHQVGALIAFVMAL
jgi:hypothetical protein